MQTLQIAGDSAYGGGMYLLLRQYDYLVEKGCFADVVSTDVTTSSGLRQIQGVRVIDGIYIPQTMELYGRLTSFPG